MKITIEEINFDKKREIILENEINIENLKIGVPEEEIMATRE